jgi:hypothetical protein
MIEPERKNLMPENRVPSELKFPTRSDRSTDKLFTWDEVREILDKQIMRRAEYVTAVVQAMRKRFGEEAYEIASEAIYQIGYRKGQARSAMVQEQGQEIDLESLSELIGHEMSRLYLGNTIEVQQDQLTVRETYCPLPVYWKSIGFSDTEIVRLCRVFDQVDKGMVEGYNPDFTTELGGAEQLALQGYCQMVVRRK